MWQGERSCWCSPKELCRHSIVRQDPALPRSFSGSRFENGLDCPVNPPKPGSMMAATEWLSDCSARVANRPSSSVASLRREYATVKVNHASLPARMARVSSLNIDPRTAAAIDLGRVLERLEKKILSADADPRLLHSSFERTKTAAVSSVHAIFI